MMEGIENMARDDYHVIVYQILAYLYQQLKKGEPIDGKQISMNSDFFSINERYWKYIIVNMYNEGLIKIIVQRNFDTAKNYLWSIPSQEIITNPNLGQNDNY